MVVFGGSYGIGADIAELAEQYGATVFSFSRSTTRTHVERRGDVRAAVEQVLAATGQVDFVVNAAAVLPRGDLVETTEETVYNATEVNYLAPVHDRPGVLPAPAGAPRGSMLNFTSSSYTRGRRGYSLYSSTKAAVVNLTQALADEWSDDGVRVNVINPERTGTPMRTARLRRRSRPGTLLDSERGRPPLARRAGQRRDRHGHRHPQGRPALNAPALTAMTSDRRGGPADDRSRRTGVAGSGRCSAW